MQHTYTIDTKTGLLINELGELHPRPDGGMSIAEYIAASRKPADGPRGFSGRPTMAMPSFDAALFAVGCGDLDFI